MQNASGRQLTYLSNGRKLFEKIKAPTHSPAHFYDLQALPSEILP